MPREDAPGDGRPGVTSVRGLGRALNSALLLIVASSLVTGLVACQAAPEPPASTPAVSSATVEADAAEVGPQAVVSTVSGRQWQRMIDAGMVRPECPIQRPEQLRSLRINHFDFEGEVQRGQLIVNADVASSLVRILRRLYEARFPIRRMRPVEAYGGDTNASLRADNTSAFNCRRADQINAPFAESPHANGRAIDINPRENPWLDLRCGCWLPTPRFKSRSGGPGSIDRQSVVWQAFRTEGWIWQDIDVPDYMHFDTGYPSVPFESSR